LFREIDIASENRDVKALSQYYSDDFKLVVYYQIEPIDKKGFLDLFQSYSDKESENRPLEITRVDLKSGRVYVTDGDIHYLYRIRSSGNRIVIEEIQDLD